MSGPRKKGFLGFLVNIRSFQAIFKIYVEEKELLSYLLGHKFSQDPMEMIFGTIHSSLGLNNNPTVIQEGSYVKSYINEFFKTKKKCSMAILHTVK